MRIARPLPDGSIELERSLPGNPATGNREVIRLSPEDLNEIALALADTQWQLVLPLSHRINVIAQAPINGRVIPLKP